MPFLSSDDVLVVTAVWNLICRARTRQQDGRSRGRPVEERMERIVERAAASGGCSLPLDGAQSPHRWVPIRLLEIASRTETAGVDDIFLMPPDPNIVGACSEVVALSNDVGCSRLATWLLFHGFRTCQEVARAAQSAAPFLEMAADDLELWSLTQQDAQSLLVWSMLRKSGIWRNARKPLLWLCIEERHVERARVRHSL